MKALEEVPCNFFFPVVHVLFHIAQVLFVRRRDFSRAVTLFFQISVNGIDLFGEIFDPRIRAVDISFFSVKTDFVKKRIRISLLVVENADADIFDVVIAYFIVSGLKNPE